ncbi:MAG: DJ-1/PfpI family protein [Clostridia bacterium]|nr:DJ-1/PfpI family protein [Clostridia bacterium]
MVYMFLANGFEEIEALCPLDLMRRASINVKTVSVNEDEFVTGSHGITVKADITADKLCDSAPEMVILPGGLPGTTNLEASATVQKALDDALVSNAYICAICAAPSVLGKRGILKGKEAICYPGFEQYLEGARISDKKVVTDGKIITAAGMGVSLDFGLAIVSALCGKEKAEELRKGVRAD